MKRMHYQYGNVQRVSRQRGPDVWVYRYREGGVRRAVNLGTTEQYSTEAMAIRAAEALRLHANSENRSARAVSFGALVDRYMNEELPERYSTRMGYRAYITNYIKPKWSSYELTEIRPFAVEQWLKKLPLASKSRSHIRNIMRILFNCAMRWDLLAADGQNPMRLVRVKDGSKRRKEPRVLNAEEFNRLLKEIDEEPFRTMVLTAVCLGLRVSG